MKHWRGEHLTGLSGTGRHFAVLPTLNGRLRRAFAPLRRLAFGPGLLALGMAVSACVPETTTPRILPPSGASPRQAMEEFVIAVATADVLGDACGAYGIRKNYTDTDTLIRRYILELYERGYSLQELERAVDGASVAAAGQKSIRRLQAAGVRQGDVASLCRYGKSEMAKGSAIGRLLRSTK